MSIIQVPLHLDDSNKSKVVYYGVLVFRNLRTEVQFSFGILAHALAFYRNSGRGEWKKEARYWEIESNGNIPNVAFIQIHESLFMTAEDCSSEALLDGK